ncbi:hypothetical protein LGQ02_11555 [Bacillus shivajii]|uniref:hypothetical protein n=1 Tax=Bacillus shivajii TaxID=1983719 RepID=UPI001CF99985|nr:hypothetical protein [Bacillus shivajii]UCZ51511.1 hypothetical protein LGQ02_11555 [Bacillus shivajii]
MSFIKVDQTMLERRKIHHSVSYHDNLITYRHPWVVAWWSAALPGFGHFMLCKFVTGFILFIWEITVNVNAGINAALMYSMIGEMEKAIEVINPNWLLLYPSVYVYGIWDSYRRTVEMNGQYVLAYRENSSITPFKISALEINFLDRRQPWISAICSILAPGLGYLYINRIPSAVFTIIWWIVIIYFSNFYEALLHTMLGDISYALSILNPQWFLFIPSIYVFSIYDSYAYTVDLNKVFEKEQANYLKRNYQNNAIEKLAKLKK